MTSESKIQKARQNLALKWGPEGIAYYIELGLDSDFEDEFGKTEHDLWSTSKFEVDQACLSIQRAVEVLDGALSKYEHLYQAKNFYFESLEEYWLMNFTYDLDFESALEPIVEDSYNGFRTHGASFEDAEAGAEFCQLELDKFLSESDTEKLLERMVSELAGQAV